MDLMRWLLPRGWRAARLYNVGTLLLHNGRLGEAIVTLSEAVEEWPMPEAFNNLGLAFTQGQMHADAIAAFDRALSIRPHFPEAHNNKGRALAGLGQYHQAIDSFDRAIALRPNYRNAIENRRMCEDWIADQNR